jgi:hypothetical protein
MRQAQSLAGEAASYAAMERRRASNSTSGIQQSDLIAAQTSAAAIANDDGVETGEWLDYPPDGFCRIGLMYR